MEHIKRNYILHEAAHCIAFRSLSEFRLELWTGSAAMHTIVAALLEESFANAVERFASAIADSNTHRLLLSMNSHVSYAPFQKNLMHALIEHWGFSKLFSLAVLAFFLTNCRLHSSTATFPPEALLERVFDTSTLTKVEIALLVTWLSTGFEFSASFQGGTSRLYFRQFGCEDEYVHLCKRTQPSELIQDAEVFSTAERLGAILFEGNETQVHNQDLQTPVDRARTAIDVHG